MMFRFLLLLWLTTLATPLAAVEPGEILPPDAKYDPAVPSPASFFGFEIGQRHLHHHELVAYLRELAKASPRVALEEYGTAYSGRPLVLLTITSQQNFNQLEDIRQQHLQLADPEQSAEVDIQQLPAVINMGYSVHGNEPSGGNVAPLVAYHLAALQGPDHQQLLEDLVILLDPCLNPDGFERFADWANNHRGAVANPDPEHREHNESWPSGRTNYYWFDLNRDWLPAQHPESQGRLEMYHRWKPNVLLDFHEMGKDSTYFFQPGVPERNHPLTPERTFRITGKFAERHAAALDAVGSLYFTKEGFDDYYMGKGSTYPDLHGAIGILFEQGSSRGQVQETVNSQISFPFTIKNQLLTSLSSLDATLAQRQELLDHKRTFYRDAMAIARSEDVKGYVVAAPHDPPRLHRFLEILHRHDIRSYRLEQDLEAGGKQFRQEEAFVIPALQPEFRFVKALFETRATFEENIFYDISTWTLPLAFNLQYAALDQPPGDELLGEGFAPEEFPDRPLETPDDAVAYLIGWQSYRAPKALYQLLDEEVIVKVATKPFRAQVGEQTPRFDYGSLLVPLGIQEDKRGQVIAILEQAASDGVRIAASPTSLTPEGIDFGSSSFKVVPKPKLLLVTGRGISAYEAGEVWHLLDQRFSIPVTLVDSHRLASVELADYTAVALVSGSYSSVSSSGVSDLKEYLREGGTVVSSGSAARWLDRQNIVSVKFRSGPENDSSNAPSAEERRPYAEASRDAAFKLLRGSIFQAQVDHTHPVGYGYPSGSPLPIFRNNRVFLEIAENAYSTPVIYDSQPLLSGYVSDENLETLSGSASVVVHSVGRGRAIVLAENPNFRAFWYGTNRLFLNSLFFGPITRVP